ncbi:MAG: dihydrodipicolinate synthase family protein [Acidobacteria bacterium]|nr:dihydrodipicolinate synthase family protein [Acidobacteriota bacterium]
MMEWLKGIIPPLVTPFDQRGKIDKTALAAEAEFQISCGATAFCVSGSTGEGAGLKPQEIADLCATGVETARGRVPVIGGVIPDTTDEAIELSLAAKQAGVKALQITPPHYLFRPGSNELVSYYSRIKEATGLPIILYNVIPWAQVSAEAIGQLFNAGAIDGVKQSGSNMHLIADLLYRFGKTLPILSAVDDLLYPSFVLGARGAVAAIVTVLPKESVALYNAVQKGDQATALEMHGKLLLVWRALEGETGFPGRVKYAIALQGRPAGLPRHPQRAANEEDKAVVRKAFEEANIPVNSAH